MEKKIQKQGGITLVALIITIIVMLILVAVSVNVLIKSNLIGTAEKAGNSYKTSSEQEQNLGNRLIINGKEYSSIDDFVTKKFTIKFRQTGEERSYEFIEGQTWEEFIGNEDSKKMPDGIVFEKMYGCVTARQEDITVGNSKEVTKLKVATLNNNLKIAGWASNFFYVDEQGNESMIKLTDKITNVGIYIVK